MKKLLIATLVAGGAVMAKAEGTSFDPSSVLSTATTTVTGIVASIGTLLGAAFLIYLGFVGYRKGKEAVNKV